MQRFLLASNTQDLHHVISRMGLDRPIKLFNDFRIRLSLNCRHFDLGMYPLCTRLFFASVSSSSIVWKPLCDTSMSHLSQIPSIVFNLSHLPVCFSQCQFHNIPCPSVLSKNPPACAVHTRRKVIFQKFTATFLFLLRFFQTITGIAPKVFQSRNCIICITKQLLKLISRCMSKIFVDSFKVLSQLQWHIIPRFPFSSSQKQSEFCNTLLHHVSLSPHTSDDENLQ